MSHSIRWSGCPTEHGPATEEIDYVAQNSGPGMSITACKNCAQEWQRKRGRK